MLEFYAAKFLDLFLGGYDLIMSIVKLAGTAFISYAAVMLVVGLPYVVFKEATKKELPKKVCDRIVLIATIFVTLYFNYLLYK